MLSMLLDEEEDFFGSPPASDLESDGERDEGGATASLTAPIGQGMTSDCATDEPDQGSWAVFSTERWMCA